MQCGPIRHTAAKPEGAPQTLEVTPRFLSTAIVVHSDAGIQEVFRTLAVDDARTARIVGEIVDAYLQGRKVLVLTERTEHLAAIGAALSGLVQNLVTLQGRSSKKQRAAVLATLEALAPDAPRVLLSTGKLVGEGFDHPPLDTLILAMPISWKGTLQQYADRVVLPGDVKWRKGQAEIRGGQECNALRCAAPARYLRMALTSTEAWIVRFLVCRQPGDWRGVLVAFASTGRYQTVV